jgi:competence ComEA-like helix-hairpin-helix protein
MFIKLSLLVICSFLSACNQQKSVKQVFSTVNQIQISKSAININTASAAELEKLPRIGVKTAQAIVEHREKFGKFRKPEYVMFVRGVSDKRFRELQNLIRVE